MKRILILCLTVISSLSMVHTTYAQVSQKCGSINLIKNEVRLPYWNDTTCIDFFYDRKGKFKYNSTDYVPSTFISQVFFGTPKQEFRTTDSTVVSLDFNNQKIFKDVLMMYRADQLQICDIRIECDNVLGYSDKWLSIISVYLKKK